MSYTLTTTFAGQVDVSPKLARLISATDTLATITAAGYLNQGALEPQSLQQSDIVVVDDKNNQSAICAVQISSGVVTLVPQPWLQSFDVSCSYSQLASAASVTLITAFNSTAQYRIRSLQLNKTGTNFSGGGGDRLGQVTDGTSVYSLIPAATMQSLANAQWGATALPNPASVSINTATVAGANLVFKYSGGTTDYTAGQLTITGIVERIA